MADVMTSPELEAINKVAHQVSEFKTKLGDKADRSQFESVEKEIASLKKNLGNWDGDTVEAAMKKINDGNEKIHKQLEEMQEDVAKSKENGARKGKVQLFDPADIKKFIDTVFPQGRHANKDRSTHAEFNINSDMIFKTAEVMGYPQTFDTGAGTDITTFTGRFIDPVLYQRRRKRNLILDNMPIETISVPTLVYLEKVEIAGDDQSQENVGGADWIVSGEEKPLRSFRLSSTKVEAKKLAIFGTVDDELLQDVPSFETWLREDFNDEMKEEYNDGLLNNNPAVDPDAPLGMKQNAITYSVTPAFTNTIVGANYIDFIVAAAAYMASLEEEPQLAFISSDVWYAIHILKDTNERYQNSNLVYTNSLGQLFIAGVRVVQANASDVPSTHLLLLGSSGFRIKNYGPLVFERGLNADDFRKDRTSFRAYQRVLSYIPAHRYNSVLYDTFDNIETGVSTGS